MYKATVRFSKSDNIGFELDPNTKKVIITAVIDDTAFTGAVTLKPDKAVKRGDK